MAVILLVSAGFLAKRAAIYVQQSKVAKTQTCIVIDAGHGGDDPGKIGINGEKEKELNLAIAKKLQKILEKKDYRIVLTRDSNKGLYHRTAHNKKVEDMKKRCEIINKEKPVFTISIHQEGKELAEVLQKSLVAELDKENHRTAKANESYYLLKKTKTPTVIVECGFLSNRQEAELLSDAEYQQKVAVAISKGIENYLNEEAKSAKKP